MSRTDSARGVQSTFAHTYAKYIAERTAYERAHTNGDTNISTDANPKSVDIAKLDALTYELADRIALALPNAYGYGLRDPDKDYTYSRSLAEAISDFVTNAIADRDTEPDTEPDTYGNGIAEPVPDCSCKSCTGYAERIAKLNAYEDPVTEAYRRGYAAAKSDTRALLDRLTSYGQS